MFPEDLEPCPECGEYPEVKSVSSFYVNEFGESLHICQCKCGFHKTGSYYDKENAIKEWNVFARRERKKKELGPVSNGSLTEFLNER